MNRHIILLVLRDIVIFVIYVCIIEFGILRLYGTYTVILDVRFNIKLPLIKKEFLDFFTTVISILLTYFIMSYNTTFNIFKRRK